MSLLAKLNERASQGLGLKHRFGGFGGYVGIYGDGTLDGAWPLNFGTYSTLAGAQYDYKREAGDPLDNSIVAACIRWATRTLPQARQIVTRPDERGRPVESPNHPGLDAVLSPRGPHDADFLRGATVLSLFLDGNAYWRKVTSRAGKVVGFIYIPHYQMSPYWSSPNEWITGYVYTVDGQKELIPAQEIVHFKDPNPDFRAGGGRKGLSPLKSVLREVCTDNEAATFSAALLRNLGVPGLIVSPKSGTNPPTAAQARAMKEALQEQTTGDRRGETIVPTLAVDVTQLGFSPEDIVLDKIRDIPEERICSVLGIPPVVVGLGAGLQAASEAQMEPAERWAWNHCLVPLAGILDGALTSQYLQVDVGRAQPYDAFGRDYTRIAAMKKDLSKDYARLTSAVGGPWLRPNEARAEVGYDAVEGGDKLYENRSPAPTGAPADNAEDRRQDPDQVGDAEQTSGGRGGKKPEKSAALARHQALEDLKAAAEKALGVAARLYGDALREEAS